MDHLQLNALEALTCFTFYATRGVDYGVPPVRFSSDRPNWQWLPGPRKIRDLPSDQPLPNFDYAAFEMRLLRSMGMPPDLLDDDKAVKPNDRYANLAAKYLITRQEVKNVLFGAAYSREFAALPPEEQAARMEALVREYANNRQAYLGKPTEAE